MDAFTAAQTTELVARIGAKKSTMRLDKLFLNSFMTGPLLAFGSAVLLSTNTAPWYQENAPGLIRTIGALLFPIGLVMIVLTGSDLFTSNVMFMVTALLSRRITILDLVKNWIVSFIGNLAGTLFFMAIVAGYGGVFSEQEAYRQEVFTFATQKAVLPQWHQIFLRAIGANWLVCLAVYMSISAREIISKIVAIWWPTATFVALALDHVIANMFFIPMAIFLGHPQISTSYYIWKSLIPTLLGNIVGGGLFVAVPYWFLYIFGEETPVDFNVGAISTAEQSGGGALGPSPSRIPNAHHIIHGREVDHHHPANQLPHSGNGMISGISSELNADKFGKEGRLNDAEKRGRQDSDSDSERTTA